MKNPACTACPTKSRTERVPMITRIAAGLVALSCAFMIGRPVAAADQTPNLSHCYVQSIAEAEVPAQEAGVITGIKVKPGDVVKKGEVVANIDDAIPRAEKR